MNVPAPHCQAMRWVISHGGTFITNMWIAAGTWMCSHICTQAWTKSNTQIASATTIHTSDDCYQTLMSPNERKRKIREAWSRTPSPLRSESSKNKKPFFPPNSWESTTRTPAAAAAAAAAAATTTTEKSRHQRNQEDDGFTDSDEEESFSENF